MCKHCRAASNNAKNLCCRNTGYSVNVSLAVLCMTVTTPFKTISPCDSTSMNLCSLNWGIYKNMNSVITQCIELNHLLQLLTKFPHLKLI